MKAKTKKNEKITKNTNQISYLAVGLILIGAALGSDKSLKAAGDYVTAPEIKAARFYQDFQTRLDTRIQKIKQNPAYADKLSLLETGCSPYERIDTTLKRDEEKREFMQDIFIEALKDTVKHSNYYREIRENITKRMLLGMEPSEASRISGLRKPTKKQKTLETDLSTSLDLEGVDLTGKLILNNLCHTDRIKLGMGVNGSLDEGLRITGLSAAFEKYLDYEKIYTSLGIKIDTENPDTGIRTDIGLGLSGYNIEEGNKELSANIEFVWRF
jgi:hypothetical protein